MRRVATLIALLMAAMITLEAHGHAKTPPADPAVLAAGKSLFLSHLLKMP